MDAYYVYSHDSQQGLEVEASSARDALLMALASASVGHGNLEVSFVNRVAARVSRPDGQVAMVHVYRGSGRQSRRARIA